MIIVLFGQPGSGKSVLSKSIGDYFIQNGLKFINIDGDEIRRIFNDNGYDKNGRLNNLKRISDISKYLSEYYDIVTVSAVFPLLEAREYLNLLSKDILWIYLTFTDIRGREQYSVSFFENPNLNVDNIIHINTTEFNIEESTFKIIDFYNEKVKLLF